MAYRGLFPGSVETKPTPTSLFTTFSAKSFSFTTIAMANSVRIRPWPKSPNMTAKRKGKVTMEYTAANQRERQRR